MSFFATAEHEKEKLQYFASPEGRDDLYQYNQRERRTVVEVKYFNCVSFDSVLLQALCYTIHYFIKHTPKELVQTCYLYQAFSFCIPT